jgi:hypothetical protein
MCPARRGSGLSRRLRLRGGLGLVRGVPGEGGLWPFLQSLSRIDRCNVDGFNGFETRENCLALVPSL